VKKKKSNSNIIILSIAAVSMIAALVIILSLLPANRKKALDKVEKEVVDIQKTEEVTEETIKSIIVTDFQGNQIDLLNLGGKVTIIDFWATWCPPCRLELPHFQELWDKYKDDNFMFVGITLDRGGEKDAKPFLESNGYTFPVALPTRELIAHFGNPQNIPTTFVIDSKGEIAEKIVGARDKAYWESIVTRLLSEKS